MSLNFFRVIIAALLVWGIYETMICLLFFPFYFELCAVRWVKEAATGSSVSSLCPHCYVADMQIRGNERGLFRVGAKAVLRNFKWRRKEGAL